MLHTDDELIFHISLARITFLKYSEKVFLSKNIDNSSILSLLSIEEIEKLLGRDISKTAVWDGRKNLALAKRAFQFCKNLGIKILLSEERDYPELLRQISDPPYLLFCRGDERLLGGRSVSVVGTRRLTTEGKRAASEFAYAAATDGCNVVSGLANGADGYAHQGAVDAYFDYAEKGLELESLGRTIAVLPSAIDDVVPATHKRLATQILQSGGLLVSEYEPGMGMANWHFVARNRIIAGLSPATVVVEAPAGSGALITADFAVEMNRDLMFHKASFGELAKKIAETSNAALQKEHALGNVSKYKLENRPEKFLEAGAPVISDYKDYKKCLAEAPGTRNPVQGELFL